MCSLKFDLRSIDWLGLNVAAPGSRGVTTIYAGTGCVIFMVPFFRAEDMSQGAIFGKITSRHRSHGFILENNPLGY